MDPSNKQELGEIRRTLDAMSRRLAAIERQLGMTPATAVPPVVRETVETVHSPAVSEPPFLDPVETSHSPGSAADFASCLAARKPLPDVGGEVVDADIVFGESAGLAAAGRESRLDQHEVPAPSQSSAMSFENIIGGRVFTWVGGVLLVLAAAYFVMWSWRHLEIPPIGRVAIINALGVAGLAAGWFLGRKDLPVHCRALYGVGIFILYAAALAMTHLYRLGGEFRLVYGFINGILVTVTAMLIAVRLNSVGIVLLGAFCGYLTPILAWRPDDTGVEDPVIIVYLAMLNLALIGSASIRRWEFVKVLAWIATAFLLAGWLATSPFVGSNPLAAKGLLTLHAVIFAGMFTLPHLVQRTRSTHVGNALLVLTSLGFLGSYGLVCAFEPAEMTRVNAVLATIFALVAMQGFFVLKANDRLARVALALACTFGSLAIALALRDHPDILSLVWAVEGAAFALVALRFTDRQLMATSVIAFSLALAWLLWDSKSFDGRTPLPWVHPLVLRWGFLAICLAVAGSGAMWIRRFSQADAKEVGSPLRIQGEELNESRLFANGLLGFANLVLMMTAFLQLAPRWDWLLVVWTLHTAVLMAAGLLLTRPALRMFAASLLVLAPGFLAAGLVAHDTSSLEDRHDWPSRLAIVLTAAVWLTAGWSFRKFPNAATRDSDEGVHGLLLVMGHVFLVYLVTVEIHLRFAGTRPDWTTTEMAAWSIAWGAYAVLAIASGILLRLRVNRIFGIILFSVVLLKVFLVDLANYELIIRVVALFILGMMLLGVSYLYQKFTSRIGL